MREIAPGTYRAQLALDKGEHTFKIGSEDWASVDFGGGADPQVALDGASPLTLVGNNLRFAAPAAGVYRFTLTTDNPLAPSLRIDAAGDGDSGGGLPARTGDGVP